MACPGGKKNVKKTVEIARLPPGNFLLQWGLVAGRSPSAASKKTNKVHFHRHFHFPSPWLGGLVGGAYEVAEDGFFFG